MRAERLLEILSDQPIIAAVKNNEEFQRALQSDVGVIFLLYGNILTVSQLTAQVHDCGKLVFVHLDMIEGLASKEVAADFIAGNTVADGVISTKAALTRRARELGLWASSVSSCWTPKPCSASSSSAPAAPTW